MPLRALSYLFFQFRGRIPSSDQGYKFKCRMENLNFEANDFCRKLKGRYESRNGVMKWNYNNEHEGI